MKKSTTQRVMEVHRDQSLTSQEKMALIHDIMHGGDASTPAPQPLSGHPVSECPKYQRGCWLVCPTQDCGALVCCRLCPHPHPVDRYAVSEIVCKKCNKRQPASVVSAKSVCSAEGCNNMLGEYYCSVCHMYSNDPTKPMFHCVDCGYCIGGVEELYPHCNNCGIHVRVGVEHGCQSFSYDASDGSVQECPVCLDPLKGGNMTRQTTVLRCGHVLHHDCFKHLLLNDYRCPTCKKSAIDMTQQWRQMDMQLAMADPHPMMVRADTGEREEMPAELKTKVLQVSCNDCGYHFERLFSPYNIYKCGGPDGKGCGSYNTVV